MIRAHFYRDGESLRMTIDGHAGYGRLGNDVVCAAVSGIFYALMGYLRSFKRDMINIRTVEYGHADIICDSECEEALKLACMGIFEVALTYPDHVKVENELWNWRMRRSA